MGTEITGINQSNQVTITKVPQVGEKVWFVADDELYRGMTFEGVITAVELTHVKAEVFMSERDPKDIWTLPINSETFPLYFSYEEYLIAQLEEAAQVIHAYYKQYGSVAYTNPKTGNEVHYPFAPERDF